jgi:glycosyltransferase involved in cell wall biosynthesis
MNSHADAGDVEMDATTRKASGHRFGASTTTHGLRLAYVVNQYPKVSHTFIRREILALEQLGYQIERYSIRRTAESLDDRADQIEQERTHVVLDDGWAGLGKAMLGLAVTRPRRLWRAAKLATKLGARSDRGLLRHFVYLAEGGWLARRLSRTGCQHVHAHFGTNSATVAMLCHELGGPPFSFTVHGPEEFDKPEFLGLRDKIARSAFVIAISSFGKSQLFRQADAAAWPKIHVVRCGVDADFFDAPRTPVPAAPRLVCVGRLCEQKGQLLLIEAAARLKRDGVAFELVLVGDGEMRATIEEAARRHQLEDRLRITGWAKGERVRREIAGARALVLPSFAEGLPVVLMEAFALGRPVISTYVAGIPELVQPGRSGWLVPAGSVDALAAAMREALTMDPAALDRMAKVGETQVRELHDIRTSAQQLASMLEKPRAEGGRPHPPPSTENGRPNPLAS